MMTSNSVSVCIGVYTPYKRPSQRFDKTIVDADFFGSPLRVDADLAGLEAAQCCGLTFPQALWRIELPPGLAGHPQRGTAGATAGAISPGMCLLNPSQSQRQ
ncbi:MAG: hypothetical protein NHG36_14630 [Chromatiaceae bacterium]|nr:hypothetical protein [Candidatus Thioaporhodococcus sediminis]